MINEIMRENSTKSKYMKNLMNNENITLGYLPPYGKTRKSKNVKQLILMNVDFFLINRVLLREYYLFRQNAESSLEQ